MAVLRYRFIAPSHHEFHAAGQATFGGGTIDLDESVAAFYVANGQLVEAGEDAEEPVTHEPLDLVANQPDPPPVVEPSPAQYLPEPVEEPAETAGAETAEEAE